MTIRKPTKEEIDVLIAAQVESELGEIDWIAERQADEEWRLNHEKNIKN